MSSARPERYKVQRGTRLSWDEANLAIRRSRPFLEQGAHLPLEHLLAEAWLQGVRDCLEVRSILQENPNNA